MPQSGEGGGVTHSDYKTAEMESLGLEGGTNEMVLELGKYTFHLSEILQLICKPFKRYRGNTNLKKLTPLLNVIETSTLE